MYLYTETKKEVQFNTSKNNKIGGHQQGNIFKLSEDTCLKVYKNIDDIDLETLKLLKYLNLKNYYRIYDFYYDKKGIFKASLMKYYKPEEIDILSETSEYTIENLLALLSSVSTLNQNHILISDTHSDNVILGKNEITVIDTDLYRLNRFFTQSSLEERNINALKYLFQTLYIEALKQYHPEYCSEITIEIIKNIFKLNTKASVENTINTLSQYKYPIDYIRKKVR